MLQTLFYLLQGERSAKFCNYTNIATAIFINNSVKSREIKSDFFEISHRHGMMGDTVSGVFIDPYRAYRPEIDWFTSIEKSIERCIPSLHPSFASL
jgi:hypothetical protein